MNMATDTWVEIDPRRSHPNHPIVDDDSAAVLDEAVYSLTMLRSPMEEGDAGARLHALASLIAQAETSITGAVTAARDQGYSWPDIANRLGLTTTTARRRHQLDDPTNP
jgi:hypothetical protein